MKEAMESILFTGFKGAGGTPQSTDLQGRATSHLVVSIPWT